MPRKPRLYLAKHPYLISLCGNNAQSIFFTQQDYQQFARYLNHGLDKYRLQLHAYALLNNRILLLLTPLSSESIAKLMQYINGSYVRYVNRRHNRTGGLFQGRHKASLVEHDSYLMWAMYYLDGIGQQSTQHDNAIDAYTSYAEHTGDHQRKAPFNLQLIAPTSYLKLADCDEQRQDRYRQQLFLEENQFYRQFIEAKLHQNFPIASQRYINTLSFEAQLLFTQNKPGRPRKNKHGLYQWLMNV
ncbi:transposase [Thalassotalea maritima]|uniref:transposase n=1 Tax=Thalassotalea maritima TaxID=3242416 RepID=UPI003528900A